MNIILLLHFYGSIYTGLFSSQELMEETMDESSDSAEMTVLHTRHNGQETG